MKLNLPVGVQMEYMDKYCPFKGEIDDCQIFYFATIHGGEDNQGRRCDEDGAIAIFGFSTDSYCMYDMAFAICLNTPATIASSISGFE